jgi:hypothetical protein
MQRLTFLYLGSYLVVGYATRPLASLMFAFAAARAAVLIRRPA